ncbi:thiamine-phosphate kinase [Candidatus Thioglobus sp.]|uniref:thiamine-phosphate kinase n=1 Tax=Candidatus Thioglobus sp. TaxID=2026721 RepID=UPI001771937A|nr:thiamine-phosphate kinase [Candidatus Thioglobus sp.]
MNEFELIKAYFDWDNSNQLIDLAIGDDCAIVNTEPGYQLLSSVDTLIEGVHFSSDTIAQDIAYKALAVNLSDLAAMGATPKYFTLALTLPNLDEQWLGDFSASLKELANEYKLSLIGGDTTKGPLSITINITGQVKKGKALLRSSAKVGDAIFVSNTLGDAACAWMQIQNNQTPSEYCLNQLNRPKPQVKLGQSLIGIANACVDVSDGLEQDLSHVLTYSGVGASIDVNKLVLSDEVASYIDATNDWCIVLAGGDDYELCFSVPKERINALKTVEKELGITLTKIGVITKKQGLLIKNTDKTCESYQHF